MKVKVRNIKKRFERLSRFMKTCKIMERKKKMMMMELRTMVKKSKKNKLLLWKLTKRKTMRRTSN